VKGRVADINASTVPSIPTTTRYASNAAQTTLHTHAEYSVSVRQDLGKHSPVSTDELYSKVLRSDIVNVLLGLPYLLHAVLPPHIFASSTPIGMQRLWKPFLGTAVLVGGPSYLYFRYTAKPSPPDTFDLPVRVRGPDGKATMVNRAIPLLPIEQVNARIRENATSISTPRPGGIVWKQTTASLAANDPIEDANASKIVERDSSDRSPGDLLFFAVMDGHGGYHTSRLLSKVLLPAVALELSSLIKEPTTMIPKTGVLQNLMSIVWPPLATPKPFDSDPKYVSLAIQTAFANLDSEIINAPLRLLANSLSGNPEKEVPDLSKDPMAMATMLPAMSGMSFVNQPLN